MIQNARIDVPILPAICPAILPLCLAQLTENYSAYHTNYIVDNSFAVDHR
jgi:hypothetical protein